MARHHIAGRGKGEFPFANPPATVDLHYTWSWPAERMAGSQMVGLVEACVAKKCWGILTFHGINEGSLGVAESDFRDVIGALSVPTLVVLGAESKHYRGLPLADYYQSALANGNVTTFAASGHSPHREEPARFAAELAAFAAQLQD